MSRHQDFRDSPNNPYGGHNQSTPYNPPPYSINQGARLNNNVPPALAVQNVPLIPGLKNHGQSMQDGVEHVYFAVMGVTGAGKSSFIELCTQQNIGIGHQLTSCTVEVEEYSFMYRDNIRVHLIDTPGFDDTNRKDTEVLKDIAFWLSATYEQDVCLSGIVYLHRIIDVRMPGSGRRNLRMFKKLCGDDCFKYVLLATTMWENVDPARGAERERELVETEDFWGYMTKRGAQVVRHQNTRQSALGIIDALMRVRDAGGVTLAIQQEMNNEGMQVGDTSAGRQVDSELRKQRERHEKEIRDLQAEKEEALRERDYESAEELRRAQQEFEEKIRQSERDRESMRIDMERLWQEKLDNILKMQEEIRQREAEMEQVRSTDKSRYSKMKSENDAQKDSFNRKKEGVIKQITMLVEKAKTWADEHPQQTKAILGVLTQIASRGMVR